MFGTIAFQSMILVIGDGHFRVSLKNSLDRTIDTRFTRPKRDLISMVSLKVNYPYAKTKSFTSWQTWEMAGCQQGGNRPPMHPLTRLPPKTATSVWSLKTMWKKYK